MRSDTVVGPVVPGMQHCVVRQVVLGSDTVVGPVVPGMQHCVVR